MERKITTNLKRVAEKAGKFIKHVLENANMAGAPMGKTAGEIANSQKQKP